MNAETWTVKTCGGLEWGCIKKIIIDATNREISFVDVLISETQQTVRLPWSSLDLRQEGFYLNSSKPPLIGTAYDNSAAIVTVNVPSQILNRLRRASQSPRSPEQ